LDILAGTVRIDRSVLAKLDCGSVNQGNQAVLLHEVDVAEVQVALAVLVEPVSFGGTKELLNFFKRCAWANSLDAEMGRGYRARRPG
jgi:hypothetical protein